jgi:uncharacterized membrane protein HdeD (DUF308 family)
MNPFSSWWLVVIRGLVAFLFGILALVHPLAALMALVFVFGAWAFVDGVSALALFLSGWRSWQLFIAGLVGIVVAFITFFRPGITALGLYAAVAAWAIARGILEIAIAVKLRRQIDGELWLILGGISSLVFGALLIILPVAGIFALAWLVGVYALVYGVFMIGLGLRVHRVARPTTPLGAPHAV